MKYKVHSCNKNRFSFFFSQGQRLNMSVLSPAIKYDKFLMSCF